MARMHVPIGDAQYARLRSTDEFGLLKARTPGVVALDDCTQQVIRKPEVMPVTRFFVQLASRPRSLLPATFCRPVLITRMPKRNMPSPPRSSRIIIMRSRVRVAVQGWGLGRRPDRGDGR